MKKIGLDISDIEEFGVMLGTGKNVKGKAECRDVRVCLGAIKITEDFFPLELGNSDVILGI